MPSLKAMRKMIEEVVGDRLEKMVNGMEMFSCRHGGEYVFEQSPRIMWEGEYVLKCAICGFIVYNYRNDRKKWLEDQKEFKEKELNSLKEELDSES